MAGTYSGYSGVSGGDASPFPSVGLWHQVDAESNRPGRWMEQFEDFVSNPTIPTITTVIAWGTHEVFGGAASTLTKPDVEGGVLQLLTATDNLTVVAQAGPSEYPFKIIQGAGELIYETRVKRTDITSVYGFLAGLTAYTAATTAVPLVNTGVIASVNFVGFQNLETTPTLVGSIYRADGQALVNPQLSLVTLVADTYVKLGMTFNRGGDNAMRWYINGVEAATSFAVPTAAGTVFPNDVRLGWTMAQMAGATASLSSAADWVRVAQRRVAVA